MGWLQNHLETFVKPVLGYVPTLDKGHRPLFTSDEVTVLKNMWRAVKREAERLNKPILLAGRDVFIMEILARREGYPTVWRPDISRNTAEYVKEDYSGHYLFDTGFMGSIPRMLKMPDYTLGSSNAAMGDWVGRRNRDTKLWTTDPRQVFPRLKGARSLILKMERTPKYWRRSFQRDPADESLWPYSKGASSHWSGSPDDKHWAMEYHPPSLLLSKPPIDPETGIGQQLAPINEFLEAAKLTIEIYTNNAARHVARPLVVGIEHVRATHYMD